MFSLTRIALAATTKKAATKKAAAAVPSASSVAAAIDGSRFTSTPLTTGSKKKAAPLFKSPFLDEVEGGDSLLSMDFSSSSTDAKNISASQKKNSGSIGGRRRVRKSPFALLNAAEEASFTHLVHKNMAALSKPTATTDTAAAVAKFTAINKAATGTALPVMKAPQYANFKRRGTREVFKSILEDNMENTNALIKKAILKGSEGTPRRSRKHSKFYSTAAVHVRGGTYSAPAEAKATSSSSSSPSAASSKNKKNKSTAAVTAAKKQKRAEESKSDVLNPVNISASFFTSYERKQYSRLKHASLLLRNPRKERLAVQRRSFYKLWDRITEGVK